MRATLNKDIKTGKFNVTDDYSTTGPTSVFHIKNEVPERPEPSCYILSRTTCTDEQWAQFLNGTVLIKDYVIIEYDVDTEEGLVCETSDFPESSKVQKVLKQLDL